MVIAPSGACIIPAGGGGMGAGGGALKFSEAAIGIGGGHGGGGGGGAGAGAGGATGETAFPELAVSEIGDVTGDPLCKLAAEKFTISFIQFHQATKNIIKHFCTAISSQFEVKKSSTD